jgi:hypothetical protein
MKIKGGEMKNGRELYFKFYRAKCFTAPFIYKLCGEMNILEIRLGWSRPSSPATEVGRRRLGASDSEKMPPALPAKTCVCRGEEATQKLSL